MQILPNCNFKKADNNNYSTNKIHKSYDTSNENSIQNNEILFKGLDLFGKINRVLINRTKTTKLNEKEEGEGNTSFATKLNNMTILNEYGKIVPRFNNFEIKELKKIYTEENANFLDKLLECTYTDKNGNNIPIFNSFEIKELVKICTLEDIEFIKQLAQCTSTNEYGNIKPRFCSFEIGQLAKLRTPENAEVMDKLLSYSYTDKDGNKIPRLENYFIISLIETYTPESIEFIDRLVKYTYTNKDGDIVPRFDSQEIKGLQELRTKENFEVMDRLLEYTYSDKNGNNIPRFDGCDIQSLLDLDLAKNAEYLNILASYTYTNQDGNIIPILSGYSIEKLIKLRTPENAEFMDKLITYSYTDKNGNIILRFNASDVSTLIANCPPEKTEIANELLKYTYTDKNGNVMPRFNASDISALLTTCSPKNAEIINKLAQYNTINQFGSIKPRFSGYEMCELLKLRTPENAEFMDKLLEYSYTNTDGNKIPRFNSFDIKELVELRTKKNAKFMGKLLEYSNFDKDMGFLSRFNSFDIKELVESRTEKNAEFMDKLLEYSYTNTDGNKIPRFDSYDIKYLTELRTPENADLIDRLLEYSYTNINGNKIPRFNRVQIQIFSKAYTPENTELIDKLLAFSSGSKVMSADLIDELVTYCIEKKLQDKVIASLDGLQNNEICEKILDPRIYKDAQFELMKRLMNINNNDYSKLSLYDKMKKIQILQEVQRSNIFSSEDKISIEIDKAISDIKSSIRNVIVIVDIPQASKTKMFQGFFSNNNPRLDKLLKKADFTKYRKAGLPLEYPRTQFLADLDNLTEELSPEAKTNIEEKLGISLITNLNGNITGYDGIINLEKLDISNPIEKQIYNSVHKFIFENKIETGDVELDNSLNSLIQGMPEFMNIIGKQQHETHSYSVDIHILTVLNEAMKNPMYNDLSNLDKTCLKLACVMHDIAKSEGVVDSEHDVISALYARDILRRYKLPKEVKDRIYELIKNHHWLEGYNKNQTTALDNSAKFRRTGDYTIAKIMAEADLKGVNGTKKGSFYDEYKDGLDIERQQRVSNGVFEINKTGQMFLTNKIIDDRKIPIQSIDGVDYKIIDFTKLPRDFDLFQYGFEPNTTPDNLRLFTHMINDSGINRLENVYELSDPSYEGFLCASYISLDNKSSYGRYKFGVSIESENCNIANSHQENQSSGDQKTYLDFSNIITKQNNNISYRNFIPNSIRKTLDLTDFEYAELYSQIQKYKYTNQLDNISEIKVGHKTFTGKEVKEAIRKANELMITAKGNSNHNEANLYDPTINAVVAKVDSIDELPEELLYFAHEHNLPIYILGSSET